jgi:hypothetical protein
MKIAYDFDGVFHKNVSILDGLGERNFMKDNKLKEFYLILDKIRNEINDKHEIFIISRGNKQDVLETLDKLFISPLIDRNNIITDLGEKNILKSQIIKEKGIDKFYDDSIYNIHEINLERKKNLINSNLELFLVDPDTDSIKEIKKDNLKLLTYNLSWHNMESNPKAPIKECKEKDLCSSNINNLIKNQLPLDFIFLQEVSNEKVLLKDLKEYFQIIKTVADKEVQLMLVNKKYEIESTFGGEFEKGRPYLAVFLKNKICLISVHMGHDEQFKRDLKKIEKNIYKIKSSKEMESYRIILGGDFNEDIGNNIDFCGKNMITQRKKFTCCVYSTHMYKNNSLLKYLKGKNIDHILDSLDEPIYITPVTPLNDKKELQPGSDHLGLYGELKNN